MKYKLLLIIGFIFCLQTSLYATSPKVSNAYAIDQQIIILEFDTLIAFESNETDFLDKLSASGLDFSNATATIINDDSIEIVLDDLLPTGFSADDLSVEKNAVKNSVTNVPNDDITTITIQDFISPIPSLSVVESLITVVSPKQTIQVIYSEVMDVQFNPHIQLGQTDWTGPTNPSWNDDSTMYQAEFTFSGNVTLTENVELAIPSGAVDKNGNVDRGNSSTSFSIDTERPFVHSSSISNSLISDTSSHQEITLIYSEKMNTSTNPTIVFTLGNTFTFNSGNWSSDSIWVGSFDITDNNQALTTVSFSTSQAEDLAGNSELLANNPNTFLVETHNPTVVNIGLSSDTISTLNRAQAVTVTYDEAMDTLKKPNILFQEAGWGVAQNASWSLDSTIYTVQFTFSGSLTTQDLAEVSSVSGATDRYGNADIGNTSPLFLIDTEGPIAISIVPKEMIIADNNLIQEITVVYSESMDQETTPQLQFNGSNATFTLIDGSWESETEWIGTYMISDENESLSTVITTSSGTKDIIGNAENNASSANNSFLIKTKNPIITSIQASQNPITLDMTLQHVIVAYDEAIDISTKPMIQFSQSQWGNVQNDLWSSDSTTYEADIVFNGIITALDSVTISSVSGAKDPFGNDDIGNLSPSFLIDTERPTVASISASELILTDQITVQTITIIYSEPMNINVIPLLVFNGANASFSLQSSNWVDNTTWQGVYTITDEDEDLTTVTVYSTLAADFVGNVEAIMPNVNASFELKTKNPRVSQLEVSDRAIIDGVASSKNFQILVAFDDDVDQSIIPSITFPNEDPSSTLTLNSDSSFWIGANTFRFLFDVVDVNTTLLNIDLFIEGVRNPEGNLQVPQIFPDQFNIDTETPSLSITPINGSLNISPLAQIEIEFSEAMRKLDGSTITSSDLVSLVELRADGPTGNAVAFTAEVSNPSKFVLTPVNPLEFSRFYAVSIDAIVRDSLGNTVLPDLSIFRVTQQPSPQLTNVEVCFGEDVPDLEVASPTFGSVQWYTNASLSPTFLVNTGTTFSTVQSSVGTYTYFVSDSINGLQSSATEVRLTIHPLPETPNITGPTNTCPDTTILQLPFLSNTSYQWERDRTAIINANSSTYDAGQIAGDYRVLLETPFGCIDSTQEFTLTGLPNPIPIIGLSDSVYCVGQSELVVTNPNINTSLFEWYRDTGNGNIDLINITSSSAFAANLSGNWFVEITDSSGCVVRSEAFELIPSIAPSNVEIKQNGNNIRSLLFLADVTPKSSDGTNANISEYSWRIDGLLTANTEHYLYLPDYLDFYRGKQEFHIQVDARLKGSPECITSSEFFWLIQDTDGVIRPRDIVTSIPQTNLLEELTIKIYPNPSVNQRVQVELEGSYRGALQLILYSSSGKVMNNQVIEKKEDTQSITHDFSGFASGMYFLKVLDRESGTFMTRKVIIE